MITSLVTWMKIPANQLDPALQDVSDDAIDQILRNRRVTSPYEVQSLLRADDSDADVDMATGQVTFTLRDLDGTQRFYSHDYTYVLYSRQTSPFMLDVLVDDVLADPADYSYAPASMDLEFTVALAGTDPVVQVRGHIVRFKRAMMDYADTLTEQISTLASVRDGEFEKLCDRISRTFRRRFGSRVVRL
jgi:hypothetical protein